MTLRVYTAQAPVVAEALEREGVCHCRADMIQKKYGNCAPGFLTAYEFLAERAQAFVPRPKGAELRIRRGIHNSFKGFCATAKGSRAALLGISG